LKESGIKASIGRQRLLLFGVDDQLGACSSPSQSGVIEHTSAANTYYHNARTAAARTAAAALTVDRSKK